MARILVIGLDRPSAWRVVEQLRVVGHEATLSTSRRHAAREIGAAHVDGLALDSPLGPEEERRVLAGLADAIPGLPALYPRLELAGPIYPRMRADGAEPQAMARAITYLFGLADGSRIAVPAEIEPAVPHAPRIRAIATEVRDQAVLFEYLQPPPGGPTLDLAMAVLAGGTPLQATARMRFPGRGTLTVRGITTPVTRWDGAQPALRLEFDARFARTRAGFQPSARLQAVTDGVRRLSSTLRRVSARLARASARLVGLAR